MARRLRTFTPWDPNFKNSKVRLNVLVILGFYLFGRFMQKKLGQMAHQMQGMHGAQDEDLGEAEVIEDAQIEE